jgi:NAD(P)H-dependent FMN reductase
VRVYGQNCWAGKPAFITGTSGGAIGAALAQQHLRSIMLSFGTILQAGDVYVTFKPNLAEIPAGIHRSIRLARDAARAAACAHCVSRSCRCTLSF